MKFSTIKLIIGASILALVALVFIQAQWMKQSRRLLEEQFNNKVAMALCSTIESYQESPSLEEARLNCSPEVSGREQCCRELKALAESPGFQEALNESFEFYQLPLNYQAGILTRNSPQEEMPANSCSLKPLVPSEEEHLLSVQFPEREAYVSDKMGLMLGSSMAILLFIGLVFLLANYTLIRQKQLSEQNKDFFNYMAHEFRTPLTNIRLASRMLQKEQQKVSGSRYFQAITQENSHLQQQVEQILKLAELEGGAALLRLEKVNMEELLRQTIASMEVKISNYQAKVYIHTQAPAAMVSGDPLHLSNAFRNLIDNALKYSGEKPEIHIAITQQKDKVLLHFIDNGNGISPKHQPLVFKKFQRFYPRKECSEPGFGLGLSYVKRIVEMHKGVIDIASKTCQGSQFMLTLPAWQNHRN